LLKIKLLGNRKKCRKDIKCFSFEMVVDSDLTNYKDLVESVVERYPPGYLEVAHVQYYDEVLKSFPEITSDQQLMTMFSKHSKSKIIIMFIAYCGPSDAFEPISEWDFNDERQPDNNTEAVDTNTDPFEDDYLKNPLPQNEHVGVDEEIMYLENEPVNGLAVVPSSDKGKRDSAYVPDDSEGGDVSLDDSEGEDVSDELPCEEELPYDEENYAPNVEYDTEDPPMGVGSTYDSMPEFRLAISQHAIKHEFEFNIAKSAPNRFRAYCSRRDLDNCPWWIFASTTQDECTVQVIVQSFMLFFYFYAIFF